MSRNHKTIAIVASAAMLFLNATALVMTPAMAQTPAATPAAVTPEDPSDLLSQDELETLVARIALYPDDLVALVLSASANPLQVVQAARFIEQVKKKPDLKPEKSWDGSVVSLLNYPSVVTMMNDDLEWTEAIGKAVVEQQKDLLVAIQQLRDKAVASGIIKSDDKVIVEEKNDNVIIRPAKKEVTYVPIYDPVILTSPTYVATDPIIYGDPYPSYYYPYASYWPGFITGAVFGAAIDWDNWHSWGGDDIDIDIDNINRDDFKFDRNNIGNVNFDNSKFNLDRDSIANNIRENKGNRLDLKNNGKLGERAKGLPGGGSRVQSSDIRRDVQTGLKQNAARSQGDLKAKAANRDGGKKAGNQANLKKKQANANRPAKGSGQRANANRPSKKPAARVDHRPKQPGALGNYSAGRDTRVSSQRGNYSRNQSARPRNMSGPRVGHGGGGGRGGGRARR